LDLQDEVIESLALEDDYWDDEWKHDDTNGEESDGYSSVKFVVAVGVLQLDDVHSSECLKVGPYKLVSVDEHGNQEAQKEHIENEYEKSDKDFSLRELITAEVLFTVETIEDIKDNLEE
jgi:hypothetical protein